MNITRWDPIRDLESAVRQFSPFFGRELRRTGDTLEWSPIADVTETEKEYLIKAELPEVKKEDIKVSVADGAITISGERKQEKEDKTENEIRIERFYGNFSRTFALPDNVDANAIKAETKDGILQIHLPKNAKPQPKSKQIEVK